MIKQRVQILLLCFAVIHIQLTFSSFNISYLKYYYQPPRSVDYPFGDENYNEDMKGHLVQEEFHLVDLNETELYKPCLNVSSEDSMDVPFSSNECKKCDLRKPADNNAAIVQCFQCHDFGKATGLQNDHNNSIHYFVTYIELVNYTSQSNG